jgi:replicative DNA helicase
MNELKIPAHSIADEQSVIGGLILAGMNGDGGHVWDLVSEILTASDFYRADHRAIYGAISALIDRNMPIDILAICNVLRETGGLDDAGGFVYLATMAKDTPSAANIETYAKTVKTMAAKRRLVSSIQSVLDMAWSSGGATESELEALLGMAGEAVSRSEMELSGGDTSLTMQQAQKQALGLLNVYHQKRGGVIGIDTGLKALNDAVGGWHDTDFIVVQGRSGMGKTAFALSLAKAAAGRDRVGIISTEMATVQLAMRRISQGSGVSMTDIRQGNLDDDKWAHIARTITGDVETGLSKRIKINDSALELDDIPSAIENSVFIF